MKNIAIIFISFTAVLSGCAINPVTGQQELSLVSEGWEISQGKGNYQAVRQNLGGDYRLYPEATTYVAAVGKRMAQHSVRKHLPYEFVVVNSDVPNAAALPGGKIVVTRGLLLELESEAELAFILGHEITHADARHSAQAYQRSLLTSIGMQVLQSQVGDLGDLGNYGAQAILAKYSRNAESESDQYGVKMLAAAGYNPQASVNVMKTFHRLNQSRGRNPVQDLFSSHPYSLDRASANQRHAQQYGTQGVLNSKTYKSKLNRLFRAKPAYKTSQEGQKLLGQKQYAAAISKFNSAIKRLPSEGQFYFFKSYAYYKQQQWQKALTVANQAIGKDSQHYRYYLLRSHIYKNMGKTQLAQQDYNKAVQLSGMKRG